MRFKFELKSDITIYFDITNYIGCCGTSILSNLSCYSRSTYTEGELDEVCSTILGLIIKNAIKYKRNTIIAVDAHRGELNYKRGNKYFTLWDLCKNLNFTKQGLGSNNKTNHLLDIMTLDINIEYNEHNISDKINYIYKENKIEHKRIEDIMGKNISEEVI